MTVKEFTDIINENVKYQEHSPLEFWIGEKRYDIANISNFDILPNVMIQLKPLVETPIMERINFIKPINTI